MRPQDSEFGIMQGQSPATHSSLQSPHSFSPWGSPPGAASQPSNPLRIPHWQQSLFGIRSELPGQSAVWPQPSLSQDDFSRGSEFEWAVQVIDPGLILSFSLTKHPRNAMLIPLAYSSQILRMEALSSPPFIVGSLFSPSPLSG